MDFVEFNVVTTRCTDTEATIAVEGELDLYTAPHLKEELGALAPGTRHVEIDLSRVTFLDSAGLAVLVVGARRMRDRGGTASLVTSDPNIVKVLAITGVDRYFSLAARA